MCRVRLRNIFGSKESREVSIQPSGLTAKERRKAAISSRHIWHKKTKQSLDFFYQFSTHIHGWKSSSEQRVSNTMRSLLYHRLNITSSSPLKVRLRFGLLSRYKRADSCNTQRYGRRVRSHTGANPLREASRQMNERAEVNLAKTVAGELFMKKNKWTPN